MDWQVLKHLSMYDINIVKTSVSLVPIKNMNFSWMVYEWKGTISQSALIFSKTSLSLLTSKPGLLEPFRASDKRGY